MNPVIIEVIATEVIATPLLIATPIQQTEVMEFIPVGPPHNVAVIGRSELKSAGENFYDQCAAALQDLVTEFERENREKKNPSGLTGKLTNLIGNGLFNKSKNDVNFEQYQAEEELTIFRGVVYDFNQTQETLVNNNNPEEVVNIIKGLIENRVAIAREKRARTSGSITPEHGIERYNTLADTMLLLFTKKIPQLSSSRAEMKRKALIDSMLQGAEAAGNIPKNPAELRIIEEQFKLTYETVLENLVTQYTQSTENGLSTMFSGLTTKGQWKKFRETEEKNIFEKLNARFITEFNVKDYCAGKSTGGQVNQAIFADINSAIEQLVAEAKGAREQDTETHHLGNKNGTGMNRYDTLPNKILKSCIEELEEISTNKEKSKLLEQKWVERKRVAGEVAQATGEAAVMLATGIGYAVFGILYVAGAVLVAVAEADNDRHCCHHHRRW